MIILPASPIFGHAYEKVCADCIARWQRLLGKDVFFLTGTDEHGLKIQRCAEKAGQEPKQFVDQMSEHFKKLCSEWNISYDRFIRTTDADHEKISQEIFKKIHDKGEIYLGEYEGLYCAECEAFYLEKDLKNGLCPTHQKPPEEVKEESYFFKMSNYTEKVIEFLEENDCIRPPGKKKEILNRIRKDGLKDLSVSRTSFKWGIPVPFDGKHVQYVWMDALLNYVSGVGYPGEQFKKYWPADVHVIGKDILWFHSAIWYSILLAVGIKLPKLVFSHGFINTASGEKMSKSRGTVVDPMELSRKYSVDSLRYFLLREIPFGQDGNFSEESLVARINNELANELGNLLNRTVVMLDKYCGGKIPKEETDKTLFKSLDVEKISKSMNSFKFNEALSEIFSFISACNKYINDKEPWAVEQGREQVLYNLADALRTISILLSSFMPSASDEINKQLGVKSGSISDCKPGLLKAGTKTSKANVLFEKIK